jgi:methyl-accepting chemotaxis protein
MKIGKKLTIMIIVLTLAGLGNLMITLLNISYKEISRLVDEKLENLGENEARKVALWMESYFGIARTLAQSMEAYEQIDPEERRFFFNLLLKQAAEANPEITATWSCWEPNALDGMDARYVNTQGTDETGRFVPLWLRTKQDLVFGPALNYDVIGAGDYYLIPLQTGKETVIEPYLFNTEDTSTLVTSLSVPIKKNGHVIGVAGIDIALSRIQSSVENIKPYAGSIAAIFSNNGIVAGHFDPSRLGKSMMLTERDVVGEHMPDLANAIKTGSKYSFISTIGDRGDGEREQIKIMSIPFFIGNAAEPWALAMGVPLAITNAQVSLMFKISILISVITLIAVAAVSFLIARSISNPLKNVMEIVSGLGEGDLTNHVTINRKDEIGDMGKVFNGTITKISDLIQTIKNQSTTLFNIGTELSSNMDETTAAINQITSNIQNIKSRVINQSASVTETNATMEQITLNIEKLNEHVDRQSSSVSQSSSAIEEMLANIQSVSRTLVKNSDNVKELIEASEVGRSGLQEVAADIQEIARESEGLLEINAVIENIASQTDLLSMNAAIEAAHAGEAGKGFAVVADEIRKLAENSGEQSKTISTVLKKIKDSIDKITKSTNSVLKKFEAIDSGVRTVSEQEENIRNAMEEQNAGSKQILDAIGQLNEITRVVKDGSTQMLEGSEQVIKESRNLESMTQEITNGVNEMASGAEQINVAVGRINAISGENQESINILVHEVAKFKIT